MQNELIGVFVVVFAIDSIVPGPAVAMVMSRGASIGLVRTLPFIAGLVVGDLFLFLLALLGLAALAATLGPLFFIIKWIGIIYLIYLAYTTWNASPKKPAPTPDAKKGIHSFSLALLLPLGNPKAVGFYVALLPTFLNIESLTYSIAIYFSAAIVLIWSVVLVFYTVIADIGRRRFSNSYFQRWINRGSAGAIAGVAGVMAFRE